MKLIENFILCLSNKNDLVVDPYMGSGTTICVALKNNRKALGCDINKEYFKITKNRIKQCNI